MYLLSSLFRRTARHRAVASLMALDDRILADIGLTRADLYEMKGTARPRTIRSHE